MWFVRHTVLAVVVVALVGAAAYAAGVASRTTPPAPGASDRVAAPQHRGVHGNARADRRPDSRAERAIAVAEPRRRPAPLPRRPAAPHSPEPRLRPGPALMAPGDSGPQVRELQARLRQIAWFNADVTGSYGELTTQAVRGFQAKREIPVTGEVDRRTLDRLLAMTTEPTLRELRNLGEHVPGALDPRCRTGRVLCVDKSSRSLRWVVDGRVLTTVDVRFGGSATPTREGVFSVYLKSRDHVSRLYDTAMPFAMFFSGGQAVHYSPDFAAVGYAGASHGCVNVRDYDAVAGLFEQVQVGDRVVVYWS